MTAISTTKPRWRVLLIAGWAFAAGGCAASTAPSPQAQKPAAAMTGSASKTPPPLVQNCGIVSIGSPTKYVCDGKVYTSFELHKLGEDWAKSHPG